MSTTPHFVDDIRAVVFLSNEDGAPTRAVLDLPTGTVEFGLVRLDGHEWARPGLTIQHKVVHLDERPAPREPAPQQTLVQPQQQLATTASAPVAFALAAFVAAGCSGALIASAALVLSRF